MADLKDFRSCYFISHKRELWHGLGRATYILTQVKRPSPSAESLLSAREFGDCERRLIG